MTEEAAGALERLTRGEPLGLEDQVHLWLNHRKPDWDKIQEGSQLPIVAAVDSAIGTKPITGGVRLTTVYKDGRMQMATITEENARVLLTEIQASLLAIKSRLPISQ